MVADARTLPKGKTFANLNDEGEYQDLADQDHEDQDQATPIEDHDTRRLPTNVRGLIGTIMFWAERGMDVKQIAKRTGRTKERVRQILNDPEAIRRAVAYAKAHPVIPAWVWKIAPRPRANKFVTRSVGATRSRSSSKIVVVIRDSCPCVTTHPVSYTAHQERAI